MPPAYHMVVDPNMPIPNLRSPYDPEEDDDVGNEEDDTPEITINAATQIRGHGNIISIAQMDSVRIANLIASMLNGEETKTSYACPPIPSSPSQERTTRTEVRGIKKFPNINITVNCGATIIGDRNIVGPGLGDVARQMQMAQRNAAMQRQAQGKGVAFPPGTVPQFHGVATPPMSRSESLQGETDGVKRKAEEGAEGAAKRQC
jgi:hypothetical protein